MSATGSRHSSNGFSLHLRYGFLTLVYMGGIYWLSSLPGVGQDGGAPLVAFDANILHIPLYAGLAFCFLQAVTGGHGRHGGSWGTLALTLLGSGVYAALDEWHQYFVPGRSPSLGDFLLDLVGIVGALLILGWLSDALGYRRRSAWANPEQALADLSPLGDRLAPADSRTLGDRRRVLQPGGWGL